MNSELLTLVFFCGIGLMAFFLLAVPWMPEWMQALITLGLLFIFVNMIIKMLLGQPII